MHTYDEYRQILARWEAGESKKGIARVTGINRATVRECIERYHSVEELEAVFREKALSGKGDAENVIPWLLEREANVHKSYAYLLALYLGDGHLSLSKGHRVYRLRIALDNRYPGIIRQCKHSIETLLPGNTVGIVQQQGCVMVSSYYTHWPVLFPQHGEGLKHTRPIALVPWQEEIAAAHPLELLRGLYHSDGSRSSNVINSTDYPRYQFHNESPGIRRIFCATCDRLGLHWTVAARRNISIARRQDVARLDHLIGPKN